jgi:uncharacterized protein
MRAIRSRLMGIGLVVGIAAVAIGQDSPPIARYVPSVPDPAHVFVLDSAHLLSPQTLRALQDSARALQAETAADVAWVTLPTLGGRPIEEAALYIGRTWRIGSEGKPGDPLRNRGLVVLFVPDKRTTAGPNFRIEVGNGLEGTITDSRTRTISAAMRQELRAKHYDAAYMNGWRAAAALVREDVASNSDSARVAAAAASQARPVPAPSVALNETSSPGMNVAAIAMAVVLIGLFVALMLTRRRGPATRGIYIPTPRSVNDDDGLRRNTWFSSSSPFDGGSLGGGGDTSSSSSDGGSFGGGGGFSGGGSSDTI